MEHEGGAERWDSINTIQLLSPLLAGSFPDFDFAETWGIDEGETSPWLQKGVQTVVFDPNGGSCAAKSAA